MKIRYTKQFKKDYKRIQRRNNDIAKLKTVIEILASGQPLDSKYLDHPLSGIWNKHRDLHIEPDWILIYRISDTELVLERTGSHSELFK